MPADIGTGVSLRAARQGWRRRLGGAGRFPGCCPFRSSSSSSSLAWPPSTDGARAVRPSDGRLIMHEVEPPLSWRPEGQANASDETSIPDIINEHDTRSLGLRCSFDPADEILM